MKNKLLKILNNELLIHEKLYVLAGEKVSALVKNDKDSLEKIIPEIRALLAELRDQEAQRVKIVSQVALQKQIPEKEVTLSKLAQWWDFPDLMEKKKKLKSVMEKLRQENKRSTALIKQANTIYSEMREVIYGSLQDTSGYDYYGNLEKRQKSCFEKEA